MKELKDEKESTTSKKIKVIGTKGLIDAETGEYIEAQLTEVEDRDFNFKKIWMKNFLLTMDIIGNQKVKVAMWIVDHINKGNMLIATQRVIARDCGASTTTVNTTIGQLLDCDFLRKLANGVYIVNPAVIFDGSHMQRMIMMQDYRRAEKVSLSKEQKLKNLINSSNALLKEIEKLQTEIKEEKEHQQLEMDWKKEG